MEDDRTGSNQFFSLEPVDLERRRLRPVDRGQAGSYGVQPPQRPTVVVHVMAHEQTLGQTIHPLRLQKEGSNEDWCRPSRRLARYRSMGFLYVHGAHSRNSEMRRAWTRVLV